MNVKVKHLQERNGKYYLRIKMPVFLQDRWGCRELIRSLQTSNLNEASKICILLARKLEKIFHVARRIKTMTRQDMRRMLDAYFEGFSGEAAATESFGIDCANQSASEISSECRKLADEYITHMPPEYLPDLLSSDDVPEADKREYTQKDYSIDTVINNALKLANQTVELNSIEHFVFREIASKYSYQILDRFSEYFSRQSVPGADMVQHLTFKGTDAAQPTTPVSAPEIKPGKPVLLADTVDLYMQEGREVRQWSVSTERATGGALTLLIEYFGANRDMRDISRPQLLAFRKIVPRIPKNRSKIGALKGKTLRQQLELDGYEVINHKTQQNIIGYVISFFKWCSLPEVGLLNNNVSARIQLKDDSSVKADERRLPFSNDDLEKLVSGLSELSPKKNNTLHRYWITLIGMFTGMRLNEICQLYINDIISIDNIAFIDVNDQSEDGRKKLKTPSSVRIVPIHSTLLKLDFLGYHAEMRDRNAQRLFPLLTYSSANGYSRSVSRWFNDSFKKACLDNVEKKNFHSFRKNVPTALAAVGVSTFYNMKILGHTPSSITEKVYTSAQIPVLKRELEKLDYELDFFALLRKHPISDERIAEQIAQLPVRE